MMVAKNVKIVSCNQAPHLVGESCVIIDETKNTFVLCKQNNNNNLIVDKKIRLQKAGLEIMVAL